MKLLNTAISTPPTIALVQANSKGYSGGLGLAYSSNNTAGNFLVCVVSGITPGNLTNVTDSQGNKWQLLNSQTFASPAEIYEAIWYCTSCKGGANTVTVGGSGNPSLTLAEFSGVTTLDQAGTPGGTSGASGTTWSTAAITTNFANELLIGYMTANYGGIALTGGGFTVLGTNESYTCAFYKIVSTIQTGVTCSGTMTSNGDNGQAWSLSSFYTPQTPPNAIIAG